MVYSSEAVNSTLFHNLYMQISPKNSLVFRLLKTKFVLFIRSFFKTVIDTPFNSEKYIGLSKINKLILFELKNNEPIAVWKKEGDLKWEKSEFLGYQLISEYTVKEFHQKKRLIIKALQTHWNAINKDLSNIHGDLTHFNILYNEKDELFFIDKKSLNHSKLFDFFYFYSYYQQCISKCTTLRKSDNMLITNGLKCIIKDICIYESERELKIDYLNLNIPQIHGLRDIDYLKKDFMSIFKIE